MSRAIVVGSIIIQTELGSRGLGEEISLNAAHVVEDSFQRRHRLRVARALSWFVACDELVEWPRCRCTGAAHCTLGGLVANLKSNP